jgi:hypothetical protein
MERGEAAKAMDFDGVVKSLESQAAMYAEQVGRTRTTSCARVEMFGMKSKRGRSGRLCSAPCGLPDAIVLLLEGVWPR